MARGWYNNQLLMSGDIICGGFIGASMMQSLYCLPHRLPARLDSVLWLQWITSTALYHYYNAERQGVDGVDFITSHFHTKSSVVEALSPSISPFSAYKLSTITTLVHSPPLKQHKQHFSALQLLTALYSCSLLKIKKNIIRIKRDNVIWLDPSLIDIWKTDLYRLQPCGQSV